MLDIQPKYLVNEKGRKTAVVLSTKDYRRLIQRLEELEKALRLVRGSHMQQKKKLEEETESYYRTLSDEEREENQEWTQLTSLQINRLWD